MRSASWVVLFGMGTLLSLAAGAAVELGAPFSDHAVLQRGMKVPVWAEGRAAERNLTLGFRVRLDGGKAALLRYSASSIARVWLNGEFLCYGPARGPHGLDRVDEIPLAGRMKPGENILAFEVAGYNVDSFYLLNEPAYLQAEVVGKDGTILAATSPDGSFEAFVLGERVQRVPRFSFQRPFCEVYSLNPDFAAWRTGGRRARVRLARVAGSRLTDRVAPYPDYSVDRRFEPVRRGGLKRIRPEKIQEGGSVTGDADPRRGYAKEEIAVQPVCEIQRLAESSREACPPSASHAMSGLQYLLLDHGRCDTGFLGATVTCTGPGRLYFYFDEVLSDGDVNVARMGWQCVNAVTYDFTEPGRYEIEAFEPNTFRYLKVLGDGFQGTVSNLYVRAYRNPMTGRAAFESSDAKLNAVFAAARETFAQNAVDVLTDCPSRERAGWLCDSYFSGRSERWLTGSNPVERCFLGNYARTDRSPTEEDRFVPMCYPAEAGLLPNWNFWLVFEIEDYLRRTGDRAMVDALRPKVEGIVASFRKYRNADGLLEKLPGWVFIEWSFANNLVQDVNYPSNMTYAKMLETAARLYGWADCAAEAERVRETVRRQSWTGEWFCDNAVRQKDGSLKLSGECTETCQYYAFFMGLASAESHPELWDRLVRDFGPKRKVTKKHPKIHFANAFIGNYLRLELLSRAGLSAQIVDETRGYFAGMAEQTGTLWEVDSATASCDHGFASYAAVLLFRDVLGIRSVDAENKVVTVRPDKDLPLSFCRGTVPLSDGEVLSVSWRKEGSELKLECRAPSGWRIVDAEALAERGAWFREARFGMFIHWGIYSIPAKGEWSYAYDKYAPGEYEANAKRFNPVNYNPREWAKLAKSAGMKYAVLTSRHHDGFCMFDSHFTDYKITKSPYGKDAVREFLEAFRAEGLKVGLYHSLPDWTHPGYADTESPECIRGGKKTPHVPTPEQYASFTNLVYDHVNQLTTEYGKLDLLFLDYTSQTKANVDYFGRDRLLEMIYRNQPDILVNDRLSYYKDNCRDFDYYTPEICVPNQPQKVKGREVMWETCATMNDHWGYCREDQNWKTPEAVIAGLVGCVSRSGNLLLNVGPTELGEIPESSVRILKALADWQAVHGESVTGCGKSEFTPPYGCVYTQKGNNLYCHFLQSPLGDTILSQLRGKVEKATLLRTGEDVEQINNWGFELLKFDEQRIRTRAIRPGDVIRICLKKGEVK